MSEITGNIIRKSQYLTNECAEYLKRNGYVIIYRKEAGDGLEGYTIYCEKCSYDTINVIRISNHIAVLENFAKHYSVPLIPNNKLLRRMSKKIQPRYKKQLFRSFVFRDFDIPENNTTSRKIMCAEYIFSPDNIYDEGLINEVKDGILQTTITNDAPQICGTNSNIRVGTRPQQSKITNRQTTNQNMKKQAIKLNESQLRKIVKESVKKVLNEGYINGGNYDESSDYHQISYTYEKVQKIAVVQKDAYITLVDTIDDAISIIDNRTFQMDSEELNEIMDLYKKDGYVILNDCVITNKIESRRNI